MIAYKKVFLCIVLFAAISTGNSQIKERPVKTEIKSTTTGFEIRRGNKRYFIKGAGGTSYMEELAKDGGNSIRTWDTKNGDDILSKAKALGLTVTMGLNVARERHGFNYDDTVAVKNQLEKLRGEVRKYKNNSALLIWGIGNELNLEYKNLKVWNAVNDIAKMIHEEDPNHPATTMLAGVNPKVIDLIKARCPNIDLLSVQVYGGLASVPQQLQSAGWMGAYMVTEWGPTGHWETGNTAWKASIEETSSQKAAVYKSRYEASVIKDPLCVGSYVFLWGQKQERTPTWYGLFTEKGKTSEVVDVMQYLWTGKYPKIRAPHIDSILLNNLHAADNIYLKPAFEYPLNYSAYDPNGFKLNAIWELLPESTDLKNGGDRESRPVEIPDMVTNISNKLGTFKTPTKPGAYRLYLYLDDGHNKVATANIPFYVKE